MKRSGATLAVLAAAALSLSAQSMTGSTMMSGSSSGGSQSGDTSNMSAAPADSMTSSPSNSMTAASSDSMMASDMGYESLKKAGKLADPAVGSELRMAESSGMKVAFTDEMSAWALAAKNPTVLFFAADWCPSCQADLRDINANGSRLGAINVVVVNYDSSADLKAKYGITAQDSFVQIDDKGMKLAVWNGGGVDGILQHIVRPM